VLQAILLLIEVLHFYGIVIVIQPKSAAVLAALTRFYRKFMSKK
jgi:hypothetical protein